MEATIYHYKATEDSVFCDYFNTNDYTGSNANMCSARFNAYFSNHIFLKAYTQWHTKLYGSHDLNFTEKLHHLSIIDILIADEVKAVDTFEDFKEYALECFIPNFKQPFEEVSISNNRIEGHQVFTLEFLLPYAENCIAAIIENYLTVTLPKKVIKPFSSDVLYCNKTDFQLMLQLIPVVDKFDFKDTFIDEYEYGKSFFILNY